MREILSQISMEKWHTNSLYKIDKKCNNRYKKRRILLKPKNC